MHRYSIPGPGLQPTASVRNPALSLIINLTSEMLVGFRGFNNGGPQSQHDCGAAIRSGLRKTNAWRWLLPSA